MKGRHSPHPSHCKCQDLPTSLFSQEAWSSPLAWRYLNSLFLACGSAYLVASFFQGSSSWWSSVGSDMNGFWEVSSCEGPLVPRAGAFLTFGQLAGNGLPLTRMIVCLLCEFSSLHRNNLAGGGSQNPFHCDVHQGFRKILCPHWWILRILWLPSVEKKKKSSFPMFRMGVRFPFTCWESVLGRRFWCSEALLNMPVKNLLELGKKDLWLIFSIFSLFLWAAFLCVTVQMLFPFTCASREFRLNSCAVTLLQLVCFPILKCLLHQHCNNESILIATISLFYEWKDKYKKPKNLLFFFHVLFVPPS